MEHGKQNIPKTLAKLVIVFLSDENSITIGLSELKAGLHSQSYPLAIIENTIFDAELQGQAPKKNFWLFRLCQHTIAIQFENSFQYS